MTKGDLLLKIANMPDGDVAPEKIAALSGNIESRDKILTAREACQLLQISRSSLWRHFPPTLRIGVLPRWSRTALLKGSRP